MKALKFLHAADLHLDSPFKGMNSVPERIRDVIRESTFGALSRLVRLAVREKVDFAVFSGDIYDAGDRSLRAQLRFRSALAELDRAGIPALIIHGNHDPLDGRGADLEWPAGARVYPADKVETVRIVKEDRGLIAEVHGISYASAAVTENLALRFRGGDASVFQVALLHTNVDGHPGYDNYAPCSKSDLMGRGIDYWALGHIHTREIVMDQKPAAVYPGNIQGRSIRECGPRGCYIVAVDENGSPALDFHALDGVRWQQETLSIAGIGTEQELQESLQDLLARLREKAEGRPTVARIFLEGRGPLHLKLQAGSALSDLLRELRESELLALAGRSAAGYGGGKGGFGAGSGHTEAPRSRDSKDEALDSYREASLSGEVFHDTGADIPFVWIESIESRTGQDIDFELLLREESFIGDLLRLAEELAADEGKLREFADEALGSLLAQNGASRLFGGADGFLEDTGYWLEAARELAVDQLMPDGRRSK
ncbi:DNA repair exonuclease [Paenibacillus chitinolyticus]|uniref:metallophosphoesterase family protein n=1 Tax=Paenibacillus chitinolyticus TaxID=79263 RepID=UPI002DBFF165|nr:DNA repair exonuclease [Paenibacillus chitinolyticus]MEC0247695.1 DNA repair exonuclease [Paenibacillus chitinolyticus]